MSVRTRKRLTKKLATKMRSTGRIRVATSITYNGPLGKHVFHAVPDAVQFLQGARTPAKQSESDSIDWREAFKDTIAQGGEAAAVLRGARTTAGLSQIELAAKIGIDQTNLSKMENGKRPIGKELAKRLGEVLNVDYRVFL